MKINDRFILNVFNIHPVKNSLTGIYISVTKCDDNVGEVIEKKIVPYW
jgi:hypothetical protein